MKKQLIESYEKRKVDGGQFATTKGQNRRYSEVKSSICINTHSSKMTEYFWSGQHCQFLTSLPFFVKYECCLTKFKCEVNQLKLLHKM